MNDERKAVFTIGERVRTPHGEAVVHTYPLNGDPDLVEVRFASGAPFAYFHTADVKKIGEQAHPQYAKLKDALDDLRAHNDAGRIEDDVASDFCMLIFGEVTESGKEKVSRMTVGELKSRLARTSMPIPNQQDATGMLLATAARVLLKFTEGEEDWQEWMDLYEAAVDAMPHADREDAELAAGNLKDFCDRMKATFPDTPYSPPDASYLG